MKFRLRRMKQEDFGPMIQKMLDELADMVEDEQPLTTFEKDFVRTFSDDKPPSGRGSEEQMRD